VRDFRASVEIGRADKADETLLWRQRDEVVGTKPAWSFSDTTASAKRDLVFHRLPDPQPREARRYAEYDCDNRTCGGRMAKPTFRASPGF
jgi:hypothetical protein